MSVWEDDFNDSSLDSTKFDVSVGGSGTVVEGTEYVTISAPAAADAALLRLKSAIPITLYPCHFISVKAKVSALSTNDVFYYLALKQSATAPVVAAKATFDANVDHFVAQRSDGKWLIAVRVSGSYRYWNGTDWSQSTPQWLAGTLGKHYIVQVWTDIELYVKFAVLTGDGSQLLYDTTFQLQSAYPTNPYWTVIGEPYTDVATCSAVVDWVRWGNENYSEGYFAGANASGVYSVGRAVTHDHGRTWATRPLTARKDASGFQAGENTTHVKDPSVVYMDDARYMAVAHLNSVTGKYSISVFYLTQGQDAESTTWARVGTAAKIAPGGAGAPDENGCFAPMLVYDPSFATAGQRWRIYYTGLNAANQATLCLAYIDVFTNTTWTKSPDNPVLALGGGAVFDATSVQASDYFHDAVEGYVRMFYGGGSGGSDKLSGGVGTISQTSPSIVSRSQPTACLDRLTTVTATIPSLASGGESAEVSASAPFAVKDWLVLIGTDGATFQFNRVEAIPDGTHLTLAYPASADFGPFGTIGTRTHGVSTDIPVPADYNGDGVVELAFWRVTAGSGYWHVQNADGSVTVTQFGQTSDIPAPGDFDGDGKVNFAVFRPSDGNWYWKHQDDSGWEVVQWGVNGDIPLAGADYDGDGKADPAVFRPSDSFFYWKRSSDQQTGMLAWGAGTDVPVVGDFDGDNITDVASWRPSTGVLSYKKSSDGTTGTITQGASADTPKAGDFDGDGIDDFATWAPSTGTWTIAKSSGGTLTLVCGVSGDTIFAKDVDGDGKADAVAFHPATGVWSLRKSKPGIVRHAMWGSVIPCNTQRWRFTWRSWPMVGNHKDGNGDTISAQGYAEGTTYTGMTLDRKSGAALPCGPSGKWHARSIQSLRHMQRPLHWAFSYPVTINTGGVTATVNLAYGVMSDGTQVVVVREYLASTANIVLYGSQDGGLNWNKMFTVKSAEPTTANWWATFNGNAIYFTRSVFTANTPLTFCRVDYNPGTLSFSLAVDGTTIAASETWFYHAYLVRIVADPTGRLWAGVGSTNTQGGDNRTRNNTYYSDNNGTSWTFSKTHCNGASYNHQCMVICLEKRSIMLFSRAGINYSGIYYNHRLHTDAPGTWVGTDTSDVAVIAGAWMESAPAWLDAAVTNASPPKHAIVICTESGSATDGAFFGGKFTEAAADPWALSVAGMDYINVGKKVIGGGQPRVSSRTNGWKIYYTMTGRSQWLRIKSLTTASSSLTGAAWNEMLQAEPGLTNWQNYTPVPRMANTATEDAHCVALCFGNSLDGGGNAIAVMPYRAPAGPMIPIRQPFVMQLETGGGRGLVGSIPVEQVAGRGFDAIMDIEARPETALLIVMGLDIEALQGAVSRVYPIPMEWDGALQLNFVQNIPVDAGTVLGRSVEIPAEALASATFIGALPVEALQQLAPTKTIPWERTGALGVWSIKGIEIDARGGIGFRKDIPVEAAGMLQLVVVKPLSVESKARLQRDQPIAIEASGLSMAIVDSFNVLVKLVEPFLDEFDVAASRLVDNFPDQFNVVVFHGNQFPDTFRVLAEEIVSLFDNDIQQPVGKAEVL